MSISGELFKNSNNLSDKAKKRFSEILKLGLVDTLVWLGIVLLHCATIPSLLAIMSGLTDRMPSLDMVLFIWAALVTFMIRAAVMKDILNVITIGGGFVVQAVLMALVLYK
jgi:hypothetical protein